MAYIDSYKIFKNETSKIFKKLNHIKMKHGVHGRPRLVLLQRLIGVMYRVILSIQIDKIA